MLIVNWTLRIVDFVSVAAFESNQMWLCDLRAKKRFSTCLEHRCTIGDLTCDLTCAILPHNFVLHLNLSFHLSLLFWCNNEMMVDNKSLDPYDHGDGTPRCKDWSLEFVISSIIIFHHNLHFMPIYCRCSCCCCFLLFSNVHWFISFHQFPLFTTFYHNFISNWFKQINPKCTMFVGSFYLRSFVRL